jgi:glutathione peroxidase
MKSLLLCLFISSTAFAGLYDIKEKSIDGKEFNMDSLKGKPVLFVNIASQCGYTPQMTELEALHQKYKEKGLVLVGVPTNDFGGQTPEDDKAMLEFCQKNYSATFPILTKKSIIGKDKRELYKVLTEQPAKKFQAQVGWNFEKILVSKKGEVVGRFKSSTKPLDSELTSAIEKQL